MTLHVICDKNGDPLKPMMMIDIEKGLTKAALRDMYGLTGGADYRLRATSSLSAVFTLPVAGIAPTASIAPTITGIAQPGETVTISEGSYSCTPAPTVMGTLTLGGIDVSGDMTGSAYTIPAGTVGQVLQWSETASNGVSPNANQNMSVTVAAIPAEGSLSKFTLDTTADPVEFGVDTDSEGDLYWVVTGSASQPTGAQVVARQNADGSAAELAGNFFLGFGATDMGIDFSTLLGGDKYMHIALDAGGGGLSNVLSSGVFEIEVIGGDGELIADPFLTSANWSGTGFTYDGPGYTTIAQKTGSVSSKVNTPVTAGVPHTFTATVSALSGNQSIRWSINYKRADNAANGGSRLGSSVNTISATGDHAYTFTPPANTASVEIIISKIYGGGSGLTLSLSKLSIKESV